jgi:hypothetical protein
MTDPVSYTNRKGQTYYLRTATMKTGKIRYMMVKTPEGALAELPAGYAITESVNGQVSVGRIRSRMITDSEETLVQSELNRCGLDSYRYGVKGAYITVYEPLYRQEDYLELIDEMSVSVSAAKDYISSKIKKGPFEPVMRFCLVDRDHRIFEVERMAYRGRGGWRPLYESGPLVELVRKYLHYLGKESFYEL